jgi:uncharacterized alkaline shock family protein YloU
MKEFLNSLNLPAAGCWLSNAGYVLCGIAVIYLLFLIFRSRRIVVVESENGSVLLAKSALREMIVSIARELGVPEKVQTKIKCSRGKVFIEVMIRTGNWQNLSEISNSLRQKLFDTLVGHVGLEIIKKINVVVVGFHFSKRGCFGKCSASDDGEAINDHCCENEQREE